MQPSHYRLHCLACGKTLPESETDFHLQCDESHEPALLRAVYESGSLQVEDAQSGLFRYRQWLPVRRTLDASAGPVVYRSRGLAEHLGLDRLFVVFSGYWPEKGALQETCSFKEQEAPPVLARIPEGTDRRLVVASAGNTARAFMQAASMNAVPLTVVVPEFALPAMWITVPRHPCVQMVMLKDADYLDAIKLGAIVAGLDGYFPEGGAKNVARRDGMGTSVLAAAEAIGEIPQHYVQAVGSGTGGVAAWEMSKRLLADGRFGDRPMTLHLAQNAPFSIMTDAWKAGTRQLAEMDEEDARRRALSIYAPVLSNRRPPYAVTGGVFDALTDSCGHMYAVGNDEARAAAALFEQLEECDPDPAAAVAVAALRQAVETGAIGKGDLTLLNMTGGGYKRIEAEGRKAFLEPDVVFAPDEVDEDIVKERLSA